MEEAGVWDGLYEISTWIIPVFAGIILHEIAHGYAALYFGDRTSSQREFFPFLPAEAGTPAAAKAASASFSVRGGSA